MTDNDRLRSDIEKVFDDDESFASDEARLYDRFVMADKLQALIAREVRLGKIEELKKAIEIVYGMETSQMAIDEISDRIAALEKESHE